MINASKVFKVLLDQDTDGIVAEVGTRISSPVLQSDYDFETRPKAIRFRQLGTSEHNDTKLLEMSFEVMSFASSQTKAQEIARAVDDWLLDDARTNQIIAAENTRIVWIMSESRGEDLPPADIPKLYATRTAYRIAFANNP